MRPSFSPWPFLNSEFSSTIEQFTLGPFAWFSCSLAEVRTVADCRAFAMALSQQMYHSELSSALTIHTCLLAFGCCPLKRTMSCKSSTNEPTGEPSIRHLIAISLLSNYCQLELSQRFSCISVSTRVTWTCLYGLYHELDLYHLYHQTTIFYHLYHHVFFITTTIFYHLYHQNLYHLFFGKCSTPLWNRVGGWRRVLLHGIPNA